MTENEELDDSKAEPSRQVSDNQELETAKKQLSDLNDKYLRLYADFENYKKIATRSREEQLKYACENLIKDLLTVIDHLELALQHSENGPASGSLGEGVELTLKELKTVLERHGLVNIDSIGKPFDPSVHHAMAQVESDTEEENTVLKEFRRGYMFKDRVIRASLVGVAKKSDSGAGSQQEPATSKET